MREVRRRRVSCSASVRVNNRRECVSALRNSSVWDQQTLERLDILPLYFTEGFWQRFSAVRMFILFSSPLSLVFQVCVPLLYFCVCVLQSVKRKYMKVFMPSLRTRNTEKPKLKKLFKNCNAELDAKTRIRRSAGKTHTMTYMIVSIASATEYPIIVEL